MSSKVFIVLYTCLIAASADPFEILKPQGDPCFDVIKVPTCRKTLAESFEPRSPNLRNQEPNTMAFLFTPRNPDVAEPLHLCGGGLPPGSNYDKEADTEVFIHGWLDGVCRSAWMREMKEQLFIRGRYNVILVDWTWGNRIDYFVSSSNSKIVGEQVGFVINNIMVGELTKMVSLSKWHSMWNGSARKILTPRCCRTSGHVTTAHHRPPSSPIINALDPAYSPFGDAPPEERITYKDAKLVDVIHTNAFRGGEDGEDGCSALGIGDPRQLGHADFYPNGGLVQLSCYTYLIEAFLKQDSTFARASLVPQLCSHLHVVQFYKASINSGGCQFIGMASNGSYEDYLMKEDEGCDDTAVMGMDYELYRKPNDEGRKKYYLKTGLFCPYCEKSSCQME